MGWLRWADPPPRPSTRRRRRAAQVAGGGGVRVRAEAAVAPHCVPAAGQPRATRGQWRPGRLRGVQLQGEVHAAAGCVSQWVCMAMQCLSLFMSVDMSSLEELDFAQKNIQYAF